MVECDEGHERREKERRDDGGVAESVFKRFLSSMRKRLFELESVLHGR
jgi:hypothetical protein